MSALARVLTHIPAGMSVLRLLAVPWVVKLARRGARGRCCVAIAFRPAVALLVLAHLEALAITLLLDAYRQPVAAVWEVLDGRRSASRCVNTR